MNALLAVLLFSSPAQDDRKAIDRGLDCLVKAQGADGSWICQQDGNFARFGGSPTRVFATSLAGWALLEHGARPSGTAPCDVAVRRARDYILAYIEEGQKTRLANPTWIFAMSGVFIARLQGIERSDRNLQAMRTTLRCLEEFVEKTDAWGHGRIDRPNLKLSIGYNDLAAANNWVCVALSEIARAGIEVPAPMLRRAVGYFAKTQYPSGGLAYNIEDRGKQANETTTLGEGRSVASLLALMRLAPKSKETEVAKGYARKNLEKVITHHTPWLHLVAAGFAWDELGERKAFDAQFRRKILEHQDQDGSARPWNAGGNDFKAMADKDGEIGKPYMTSCFLLLLRPSGTKTPSRPSTPTK